MKNVFKALADQTRRDILTELSGGSRTAGELAEKLSVSASALSFHLSVLKAADLVVDRRKGQHIEYTLNTSVVEDLLHFIANSFVAAPAKSGKRKASVARVSIRKGASR
jgi:DNA-binding transcriptional ArsR family regulator